MSLNSRTTCYVIGFRACHEGEVDNPNCVINIKIHNVFIVAFGKDIQYYSALVHFLGKLLKGRAINIVKFFYEVNKRIELLLIFNVYSRELS